MFTGEVEPKLKVGGKFAPTGLLVTAAVKATLPVNPPIGAMVRVEVFPAVAPAVTVTAVPATVNAGDAGGVTVTVAVLEEAE
jgi:hypothetical protein